MKLSPRSCVGIVVALWLVLGSWIAYDLSDSRERERQNAERIAATLAKTLDGHLHTTVQKIDLRLSEFVKNHRQDILRRTPRERIEQELASYLALLPEALSFRIAAPDGSYIYDAVGRLSSFNVSERDYFIVQRDRTDAGLFISEPIESKVSGDWVIVMTRRIDDNSGRFAGIAIATIRLDYFEHFYSTLDVGKEGMIALWRLPMRQVARWPRREDLRGQPINNSAIPERLAAGETSGTFARLSLLDGVTRQYVFRKVEDLPFVFTVGLAEADFLAEWHKRALTYAVLGTLLAVALTMLLRNWSRSHARAEAQARLMTDAFLAKEREARALLDAIPAPAWLVDTEARILAVNETFGKMVGQPMEGLIGKTTYDLFPSVNADRLRDAQLRAFEARGPVREEFWFDLGHIRRPFEFLRVPVYGKDGQPRGLAGVAWDISDRLAAEQRQRLVTQVFDNSNEGLLILDSSGLIVLCNRAFEQFCGYALDELAGRSPVFLAAQRNGEGYCKRVAKELVGASHWRGEIWIVAKSGETRPGWFNAGIVFDAEGKPLNFIVQSTDLTERKAAEARIESLATRDQMTGLPNRQGFARILADWLASGRRGALLMIDLDSLGRVNDAFGHEAGDRLLDATATRLRSQLRETDVVGRLGGDRFGVLVDGSCDGDIVTVIVRKLLDAVAGPLEIAGSEVVSTACAGICQFPLDGRDAALLLRNAESAMHSAKASGQNQHHFFSNEMNRRMAERLHFESALRTAIERHELLLHYQPQADLASGRLTGFECLLRWRHPEMGLLLPDRIIPVAEESRLILPIGSWVLREACRQARVWQDAGLPPTIVAVNLSAVQLHDGRIVEEVRTALAEAKLDPRWLELEITESAAMQDPERVIDLLGQLKQLGVRLAIDDFGTGYSSLAYLKRFPLDKIKIDRSFVIDIESDANDAAIVRMVIGIARDLGLKVIAEGVESAGQREYLQRHQCDEIQGYYFSRPLPAEAVPDLILSAGTA